MLVKKFNDDKKEETPVNNKASINKFKVKGDKLIREVLKGG